MSSTSNSSSSGSRWARTKTKTFYNAPVRISSEQLRKVEKIKLFGHSTAPKMTHFDDFLRPGETDPYVVENLSLKITSGALRLTNIRCQSSDEQMRFKNICWQRLQQRGYFPISCPCGGDYFLAEIAFTEKRHFHLELWKALFCVPLFVGKQY